MHVSCWKRRVNIAYTLADRKIIKPTGKYHYMYFYYVLIDCMDRCDYENVRNEREIYVFNDKNGIE